MLFGSCEVDWPGTAIDLDLIVGKGHAALGDEGDRFGERGAIAGPFHPFLVGLGVGFDRIGSVVFAERFDEGRMHLVGAGSHEDWAGIDIWGDKVD